MSACLACVYRHLHYLQAVEFSWDPEDTGVENPLLTAGVVSIQPFKGRIDAAQSVLVQVVISAGCGARFLGQQPVACVVCQEPPTTVRERSNGNICVRETWLDGDMARGRSIELLFYPHHFLPALRRAQRSTMDTGKKRGGLVEAFIRHIGFRVEISESARAGPR